MDGDQAVESLGEELMMGGGRSKKFLRGLVRVVPSGMLKGVVMGTLAVISCDLGSFVPGVSEAVLVSYFFPVSL